MGYFGWTNHLRGVKIYKLWWCWSCVNVSWVNLLQFNFTLSLSGLAQRELEEVTVCVCLSVFRIVWAVSSHLCFFLYSILQNAPVGTTLFRASATDNDFGTASIVTYKIDEVCSLRVINCIFTFTIHFNCIHNTVSLS